MRIRSRKRTKSDQLLLERGAEAIVLIGETRDSEIYALLDLWKVPYTINYIFNADSKRPCVGFDNFPATARNVLFFQRHVASA